MNLLSLLAEKGLVPEKDIAQIEQEIETSGGSLEAILIKRGINAEDLLQVQGEHHGLPVRRLNGGKIPYDILRYVPEESARYYHFVPLGMRDGALEMGITDPERIEALDALNFVSGKAGMPYKVFLISRADYDEVIGMYKGITGVVQEALEDLETELKTKAGEKTGSKGESAEKTITPSDDADEGVLKEDAPVTKIVATVLEYAVEGKASDIHIEPMDEKVRVRFRVDGTLHTSLMLPGKIQRAVVARIKILSSMRLDEQRKPQDGRFSATIDGRKIDFRVSTFPTHYGEKVVMRILDKEQGVRSLEDLGFSGYDLDRIRNAAKAPYGLILISGPTGSGKTSTLYAMLNEVEREEKNVLSLEDPVEYNIEGLSQSQVFPEIGYTFASGLRTTLRQDPDIIMVGEIRDKETAQLAIQAALTGHLVFSTIHTNTAIGVIPRLIDMGVDPYLIAPTLILAVAQRLVRQLCPNSGEPIAVDGSLKVMIDKQFEDLPSQYRDRIPAMKEMYKIKPSPECPNGTRGRTAALEVLEMDEDIEQAILNNPSEDIIYKIARKKGMLTMKEDAIIKALNRIVPFEEVNTLGGALLVDDEDLDAEAKEIEINTNHEQN